MKATDFDAVVQDGLIWCKTHCTEEELTSSRDIHPIFADSEWDHYPVCDECGKVHNYVQLTEEGRKHENGKLVAEVAQEINFEQLAQDMKAFTGVCSTLPYGPVWESLNNIRDILQSLQAAHEGRKL